MARTKEVKVSEETKTEINQTAQSEKPNVETLMGTIANLQGENKFLKGKLKEASEQIQFLSVGEVHKRLNWLWNVITLKGAEDVFGEDFYAMCVEDFKQIMCPPQEEDKD